MWKKLIFFIIAIVIILLSLGTSWYLYKDTYYYNSAIKNGNHNACLKISQDLKVSVCLSNIAFSKNDLNLCSNSPKMYIMTCYQIFAEKGGDILKCQEVNPQVDEYNCYIAFAKAKMSVSICNALTEEKKDYCYQGVAIVSNDVSICNSLPESSIYKPTCARDVAQQNP